MIEIDPLWILQGVIAGILGIVILGLTSMFVTKIKHNKMESTWQRNPQQCRGCIEDYHSGGKRCKTCHDGNRYKLRVKIIKRKLRFKL